MNFKLIQMHVNNVFLNSYIQEEVFVDQPPKFINSAFPDHVFNFINLAFPDHETSS